MQHLNHLKIQLSEKSDLITSTFEEKPFRPAWSVIQVQKWEIFRTWRDTGADFEGASFRVVRKVIE